MLGPLGRLARPRIQATNSAKVKGGARATVRSLGLPNASRKRRRATCSTTRRCLPKSWSHRRVLNRVLGCFAFPLKLLNVDLPIRLLNFPDIFLFPSHILRFAFSVSGVLFCLCCVLRLNQRTVLPALAACEPALL